MYIKGSLYLQLAWEACWPILAFSFDSKSGHGQKYPSNKDSMSLSAPSWPAYRTPLFNVSLPLDDFSAQRFKWHLNIFLFPFLSSSSS